jgi:hypothetical protein
MRMALAICVGRPWRVPGPCSILRFDSQSQSAPCALAPRSIMRQMKGVKISCIASSILPPGTTMVLARLIMNR